MKSELIIYQTHSWEQGIITSARKSLGEFGIYNGETRVGTTGELLSTMSEAVRRSNLILTLVSTEEYIRVKRIISKSLGLELVKNSAVSSRMGRYRDDPEFMYHDCFPQGAVVLYSLDSLYNGYYLKSGNQCIVFAPIDINRTADILNAVGIQICIDARTESIARFIGISRQKVEAFVKQCPDIIDFHIKDYIGELELHFETSGKTSEEARKNADRILGNLRKDFSTKMYSANSETLIFRIISILSAKQKKIAISDNENAGYIVRYLAQERSAGDLCKVIRSSSADFSAVERDEVALLAKNARSRSGFDYAIALGSRESDRDTGEIFIYGAFANENGILTKRFSKRSDENDGAFEARCTKELLLIVYNDISGQSNYKERKTEHKTAIAPKKPELKAVSVGDAGIEQEVAERRFRIAPPMKREAVKKLVIIMLAVVVVVIAVAILICREPNEVDDSSASTSAVPTSANVEGETSLIAAETTDLSKVAVVCDKCGNEIDGDVYTYISSDGGVLKLCKQCYDSM